MSNKRLFLIFAVLNLLSCILSIQFAVGFEKTVKLIQGDSVLYMRYSDILYNNESLKDDRLPAYNMFPFFSFLSYLIFHIFGTSYITLQIFYFVIIFLTNFFFYYLFNAITKHLTSYIQHLLSFPFFNIQLSIYNLQYLLFLFNFVVFSAHSNKLLPENLLLGATLGSWIFTYCVLNNGNFIYLLLCFFFYTIALFTKPQGISIVLGILIFALVYKNKKLILISFLSYFPFLVYLFIRSMFFKNMQFLMYESAVFFLNWNFQSLFYGLYKFIFCIPYELVFSDVFIKKIESLQISFGIIVFLPKYIISIVLWITFIVGYIKLHKYFFKEFGFVGLCFIISFVGFLFHTTPKGSSMLGFYDARLLIYLWPFIVICLLSFYVNQRGLLKNLFTFFIFVAITCNLLLCGKYFIKNVQNLKQNNWQFNSMGLNNYKVLCLNSEDKNQYTVNLLTYTIFRKYCDVNRLQIDYDYVIYFDKHNELQGFEEIFSGMVYNLKFTIFRKK